MSKEIIWVVKCQKRDTKNKRNFERRKKRWSSSSHKTNDFKIKRAKKDVVVHPLFKMKHTVEEEEEEEDKERRLLGTREDDDDDHLE